MTRIGTNLTHTFLYCALFLALALAATQAWLSLLQLAALQTHTTHLEHTRGDAVQLLRIQSDLNQLGTAMRDIQADEGRAIASSAPQFDRLRQDLANALAQHATLASDEQSFLATPFDQFWKNVDVMFTRARGGHEADARAQLRLSLQRQQTGLTTTTAYLLLENTEAQRGSIEQMQLNLAALRRQATWFALGLSLTVSIAIALVLLRPTAVGVSRSDGRDERSAETA